MVFYLLFFYSLFSFTTLWHYLEAWEQSRSFSETPSKADQIAACAASQGSITHTAHNTLFLIHELTDSHDEREYASPTLTDSQSFFFCAVLRKTKILKRLCF